MNWEENRELGVVRLHIFNSRISNSRKIPGPKKRELGGHTVQHLQFFLAVDYVFQDIYKIICEYTCQVYLSYNYSLMCDE